MRALRLTAFAVLVFTIVGCGADERARTGGAEIVSASAPAFVSIDSDLSSDQWQQVDELLQKFPARSTLVNELRSSLKLDWGLDYEDDIKPALGEEVDLVWLDFENDGSNIVALTKPKDEARFEFLVDKANAESGAELTFAKVEDWYVLADSQAKIDRFTAMSNSGEKLADDELFNDALAELPDEALVHVYVRGQSIVEALKDFDLPGSPLPLGADQQPEFLSAALAAEGSGLRLVGSARAAKAPESQPEPFESKLLEVVPADAVAFLTFKGGEAYEQQLGELEKNEAYRMGVRELERMLGLRLESLLPLFENEVALYVRPGSPLPEFTLLLEAPNEQATLGKVRKAISALTSKLAAQPCHSVPIEAGVTLECVDLEGVEVLSGSFDHKVVVTTGKGAVAKLRSDSPRLSDDEGFKSARDAAGLPDKSSGFLWLDLEDGIPMVLGLASASGGSIPAEIRENLEPLGSFLAWAESDGRSGSFTAFLQID
jgi:Protein of unknown function (DUF3352)